jgi:hypothetical protein
LALARLLAEEANPTKMALGAARIAQAAVRAERARRELDGGEGGGLLDALAQVLADLDAPREETVVGAGHIPAIDWGITDSRVRGGDDVGAVEGGSDWKQRT